MASTMARAESGSSPAGRAPSPSAAARSSSSRTIPVIQAVRSSISAPVSPATMIPWFCISVTWGAGAPVRASNAARAPAIARARGRPGFVYGIQSARSPKSRAASAPPSRLQVRALRTTGCVCRTIRSGMSAWNNSSTDGRRPPASARRALRAARITGSVPGSSAASPASSSASSGAMSSGTSTSVVRSARGMPLGLMYRIPSALAEALPPPARENWSSRPKRRATSIIASRMAAGSAGSRWSTGGRVIGRPAVRRSARPRGRRTSAGARRRRRSPG